MRTTCYLHKGVFSEKEVCGKCKKCKHEKWSLIDGVYRCHDCYKTTREEPKGEIWEMVDGGWEEK